MSSKFIDPLGEVVEPGAIKIPKATDLAAALVDGKIEFCKLVECRITDTTNVIVVDVEVELGQKRVHDIQVIERIAVQFETDDVSIPKALALRADFPFVPHINISIREFPRELCLYATPYDELKRQWTSARFIERIRTWLALTAKGKLHQDDQPLEPLLWGYEGRIVLPSDVMTREPGDDALFVRSVRAGKHDSFLIAEYVSTQTYEKGDLAFVPLKIICRPKTHGAIRFRPSNLKQLAEFCDDDGFSLLEEIRRAVSKQEQLFNKWLETAELSQPKKEALKGAFLSAAVMLLMSFPKSGITNQMRKRLTNGRFALFSRCVTLDWMLGFGLKRVTVLGLRLSQTSTRQAKILRLNFTTRRST